MIVIYGIPLLCVFAYSLIQLQLVHFYSVRSAKKEELPPTAPAEWPMVTVQLPLYNERYVVERLLECIAQLDYPSDKLEIQVLDDSTDDSFAIAQEKVQHLAAQGLYIHHIHRTDRTGYKAGALANGLTFAKGEFVAIFDADFLPSADFLKRILPHFHHERIGMVQSRWSHLNEDHSLLTQLQAFGLDAHFTVEQSGRSEAGHFINFNGTGGVWRKACIEDAGGWSADTLTEDLDLSYRAQLKGWQFVYREDITCPAELPMAMNALKGQQFRWTKGAAECARKNLGKVWRSGLPLSTKIHALFHLLNSSIFLCIVLMAVLSVPLVAVKYHHPELSSLFYIASGFIVSLFILIRFYWVAYRRVHHQASIFRFLAMFPLFLSVSMGLSWHNAVAVIKGLLGIKTAFVRTPKFNLIGEGERSWTRNVYLTSSVNWITIAELLWSIYFLAGIGLAFYYHDYGLLPFHLMLCLGYAFVFWQSTFHSLISGKGKK